MDAAVPHWRLLTLGRLALLSSSRAEEATLGTRRRKLALLAVLGMAKRPMSRDALVEMFWGDQPEERARHSLSDALSHLRRVIGSDSIATRRSEIALSPTAPLVVDAVEVVAAARDERWGDVVDLSVGSFLDAVHVDGSPSWEQWVDRQRATLAAHFEEACRRECDRLAADGLHQRRERIAALWLDRSATSPGAAAHFIEAIAARGTAEDDRRALAEYERIRRLLGKEYVATPDIRVTAAARAVEARMRSTQSSDAGRVAMPDRPIGALPPAARSSRRRVAWSIGITAVAIVAAVALIKSAQRNDDKTAPVTTKSRAARKLYDQVGQPGLTFRQRASLLERAIALDSTFGMAQRRLALLLGGDLTNQARINELLTAAMRHAPSLSRQEQYQIEGSYHMLVTNEYGRAAAAQRELVALDPASYQAWHSLGMVYQYVGDDHRAADAYARAILLQSTSFPTWSNLIDARYAAGDPVGAQRALDSLALVLPGHSGVFMQSAVIASAVGDFAVAERQVRALLTANPASDRVLANGRTMLSRILWSSNRIDEGDDALRAAIEIYSRTGERVSSLQESLVLAQAAHWLHRDRALVRQRLADALQYDPLDSLKVLDRPYLELATTLALAGDPERARAVIAEYERVVPAEIRRGSAPNAHLALGTVLLEEREFADAVKELRQARQPLCPVCGLPELALAHEGVGDAASARAVYERFLDTPTLRRTDLVDAFHRRRVLRQLGRTEARP